MEPATWVPLVAALAATAAAAIAIWQAYAASRQAASARRQATSAEDSANSARRAADAAEIQVSLAEAQVQEAKKQAEAAERQAKSSEDHVGLLQQQLADEANQRTSEDLYQQKKLAVDLVGKAMELVIFANGLIRAQRGHLGIGGAQILAYQQSAVPAFKASYLEAQRLIENETILGSSNLINKRMISFGDAYNAIERYRSLGRPKSRELESRIYTASQRLDELEQATRDYQDAVAAWTRQQS